MAEAVAQPVSKAELWNDPEYLRGLLVLTVSRIEELASVSDFQTREVVPKEVVELVADWRMVKTTREKSETLREKYARIRNEKMAGMTEIEKIAFRDAMK